MLKHLALSAAFVAAMAVSAFAHEVKVGDLTLHHPYARATAPGAPVSGGYMKIRNAGSAPDYLIGGSADFAGKIEIHEMVMDGDVMKMRPVEGGLEIPAGGEVELKPGGYHVMFMELSKQLNVDTYEKAKLTFKNAGEVEVEFAVQEVKMGGMDHNGHMNNGQQN